MDPVQSGGPWTPGPRFVLTLFVELRTKKEPSREERDYGVGPWVLVV